MAQDDILSSNPYEVLYERESAELQGCLTNIELFSKYIKDYECLAERLSTLADRTSHEIMVPIAGSKLAYMPGYIHHTNEILVLIGDNYFVEKSTKEAVEFVERRISFCHKKIEELNHQRGMLENWLDATGNIKSENESGLVDITEQWSEEELQQWQTKHKQNVQNYKKTLAQQREDVVDIDQIFAKYEKKEELRGHQPDEEKNADIQVQSLSDLSIVEAKSQVTVEERQPTSEEMPTTRPISKFKASRMNK